MMRFLRATCTAAGIALFIFPAIVAAQAQDCGVVNGYACPSGYTCSFGPEQDQATDIGTCAPLPPSQQSAPASPNSSSSNNPAATPTQSQTRGAEGYVPVYAISGITDVLPTQGGLANFLNNLYKFLIGIAAILAVIEIIWGGLEISTQDSVSKNQDGKRRIMQALGGLLLVLSPALVFSIINPSILNLSLNLPPLDTKPLPVTNTTQGSPPEQQLGPQTSTEACGVGGDCAALIKSCESKFGVNTAPRVSILCRNIDGSIGGEAKGSGIFNRTYSCPSTQQVVVKCDYDFTAVTGA